MSVMTVTGAIPADRLGVVSPHEHILIDIRNQFTEFRPISKRALSEQKVDLSNLDALSRNPYAVKDNLVMDDVRLAEEEVWRFKRAGGDTIVDATIIGIGRDAEALYSIANATGLNIVMGCGYYTADTHPASLASKSVADVREEMLADLRKGVDGTPIRAGVIGEIGTSAEIQPGEQKVLEAAAEAQLETGVGVIVHTYPWGQEGLKVIDTLCSRGVPPHKVSINHVDVEFNLDYCRQLLRSGVFIEFDNFGKEYFINRRDRGFAGGVFARDIERVLVLKTLIDEGHVRQLLMSNDVCLKTLLHRYGGWGFDHVLTHIVPMMRDAGIANPDIEVILRDNPRRFLDA